MKKMTFKEAKKALEKNYIESLSFFAEYLNQFEEDEQYIELEKLDDKLFDRANEKWNLGEKWLAIYSGLLIAVD